MGSSSLSDWGQTACRLTEAAARAVEPWVGEGDKEAADAAAVEALRTQAARCGLQGTVVIGEGEKDDAPYLAPGTQIGERRERVEGDGLDIAVDPLEGTSLAARDEPGALSVVGFAPAQALLPLGRAFYAEKLIGPPGGDEALTLTADPAEVIEGVADTLNVAPSGVRVAVQERPRHTDLVKALRAAGAQVHLFAEGDLSFAIQALCPRSGLPATDDTRDRATARVQGEPTAQPRGPVDLLWGIGGAPEGMLAALAQRALGGAMRVRVAPQSEAERRRLVENPALPEVLDRTFTAGELVDAQTVAMALTGVTDGPLLPGLHEADGRLRADTLLLVSGKDPQRRTVTVGEAG